MADTDSEWHLDKKVPITLIAAIIVQSGAFGWYASSLSARIERVEQSMPATVATVERLNEAREDLRLNLQAQTLALNNLSHLLDERTAKITAIQDALSRIEENQPGHYRSGATGN